MNDEQVERLAYEATQRGEYDVAVRLLRPLADRDSLYALTNLGWIYQNGHPDYPSDSEVARKYYERAIALGSTKAILDMGWLLTGEGKFAQARAVFEAGKEKGGEDFEGALIELKVKEVEFAAFESIETKEYKKALDLLECQKEVDSEFTLTALGWLYQTGSGGVEDKEQARLFYRQAAEIGSIDAHFRIGMLYLEERDDEAARAAFREGANLTHFPAMTKLGEMLIDGRGGPADIEQGMKILNLAAEQRHVMARLKLIRIAYSNEKNIIRKLFLRLRSFFVFFGAMYELGKEKQSPRLYEFY